MGRVTCHTGLTPYLSGMRPGPVYREQQAILQDAADEEEDLKANVGRLRKTITESEVELKQIRSTPVDDVTRFFHPRDHTALRTLLKKIEANRAAFHEVPVGPVGQHLSINQEW